MSTVKRVVRFRLPRPSRRRTQEPAGLVAGTGHPTEACTTMGQDVAELDKGITVTTPEVTLRCVHVVQLQGWREDDGEMSNS